MRSGNAEVVRLLLSKGADPNHIDRLGWTPLLLASAQADPVVAHQLLARGANPNLRTPSVGTALVRAVHGGSRDVIGQLLAYGADRRSAYGGKTALEWAQALGRVELADRLVVGKQGR